jgi:cyclophilin family peptidyl-prolyl cis-trans isomerase/HEAT repeat protein
MKLTRPARFARLSMCLLPALVAAGCGGGSEAESAASSGAAASSATTPSERAALANILTIEDHRLLGNAALQGYLGSADPVVAAAAATAAGRIGDPSYEPAVLPLLGVNDARVRTAAALALQLLGGTAAEAPLLARLAVENVGSVRQALLDAIGHVGTVASLPAVTASLTGNADAGEKGAAAEALAFLVSNGVAAPTASTVYDSLIALAASSPEESADPAAYALQVIGAPTAPYEAAIQAATLTAPSADARAYLTDALSKIKTAAALQGIATVAAHDVDARVRAEAASDLSAGGATPVVLAALAKALEDSAPAVVVAAASAVGSLGSAAATLAPQMETLYDASGDAVAVQTALLPAIVATDPTGATTRVQDALSGALPLQLVGIAALGTLGTPAALATLTDLILNPDARIACQAMSVLCGVPAAQITATMQANAAQALASTHNFEVVQGVSFMAATFGWSAFAPGLVTAYPFETGDPNINGRINSLWALGYIGNSAADLPTINLGLADDQRLVSLQASISYQQLTGVNVSSQVPLESIVVATTPSKDDIQNALGSLVVLETTRGQVVLQMLSQTPLNAVNFVKLASSGFYDGLTFPRVIPNFIAQGGDPLGDGYGASRHFVRDEFSQVPHRRGTVGLATEGKDTGSCQFFFNTRWNENLDGIYTVFAEVYAGLDVVDAIEEGDSIVKAIVIPGAVSVASN